MAKKQKAIIDFSNYQEEELPPVVDETVTSLTTNALSFPALPVAAATVGSQNDGYSLVLGKPDYHGKAADLAAARNTLETSFRENGVYINSVAKGDTVLLAKSGYPLSKLAQPVGPLAKSILKVKSTDNPGEFSYKIEGVSNADGFLLCFTLASNTETNPHKWQWQWSPKSSGLISSLAASTRYKLVSVGVGTDPSLSFSDPIERTTQ